MSLKKTNINKKILDETPSTSTSTNTSTSLFVTNNDLDFIIKTEETLNDQMNKIFTKYSGIKILLDNLRKNSIR